MNKEEALQRITPLLEKVHTSAQEEERAFLKIKNAYSPLARKCLDLMEKIREQTDEQTSLVIEGEHIGASIMDLELQYAALQGWSKRKLIVSGILSSLILILVLWFFGEDFTKFLQVIFGDTITSGGEKYTVLGIGGAIVFFLTEGFTQKNSSNEEQGFTLNLLLTRISLAFIIPIVLVVIFFSNSGKSDTDVTALLCFAVGYSSKLVVIFLNKIVEKGEQVIKAF